jgi:glycosyltransferase involved in cell wall biosynthesis
VTDPSPLVSVVVIFLDAQRFLAEALDSVLAQTFQDFELLLVDDGSDDGSTAVARGVIGRLGARGRYLEHPGHANRGMSASRNLGIRNARGRYVALLDADDVWLPHKLARQVALLEESPEVGMVFGQPEYWWGWTGRPEDRRRNCVPPLGAPPDQVVDPPRLLTRLYPLGTRNAPCPSDLFFRREVAERAGGFEEHFHEVRSLYEDQAFLAKVYLRERVLGVPETWLRYRQHPDSCVSTVRRDGQYDDVRRYYLEWLEAYLRQAGPVDPAVTRAVERALARYRHPLRTRLEDGARAAVRRVRGWRRRVGGGDTLPTLGGRRSLEPASREFGFDRGVPIDRHYIERFLDRHASDIRGRVLEVGDDSYTRRFGDGRVTRRDVLHVTPGNAQATIVADLASADHIPSDSFDCVILTQTLHLVYDVRAALATLARIIKPGGTLLATFPGLSQLSCDTWRDTWYWGFTTLAARRMFAEAFPAADVAIEAYGNVLATSAFLYGLAAHELTAAELDHRDPSYEMLITVRVVKGGGSAQ